jgi:hypothetical protein
MLQAWENRRLQKQAAKNVVQPPRKEPTADASSMSAEGAKREPHATMPAPIDRRLISEPP